ncbi:hypothetical protein [Caballeronia sp. RCC_10]|uniref:hypothetical protein n=1 Tax=Caballeronia sp. RCC_10 TaxID=3239227 RepID=UPI003524F214
MALKHCEASFAPVLPRMRAREQIVAEVGAATSGRAVDVARSTIAEIELHVKDGDGFYRQGKYGAALDEFQWARALIYQLLHPEFHVPSYLGSKNVTLPVSKEIETNLLTVSSDIADLIRPQDVEMRPSFWRVGHDTVPESLKPYLAIGFHEVVSDEEVLQLASAQGVALLKDNRPEAALKVMGAAAHVTPDDLTFSAALHLNIACALLQLGDAEKATDATSLSLKQFTNAKDMIGTAQAAHLAGICATRTGNPAQAKEFFTQAGEFLSRVPAQSAAEGAQAPGMGPERLAVALNATILPAVAATALREMALNVGDFVSRDMNALQPISQQDAQSLTFRVPGRADGWGTLPSLNESQIHQQSKTWQVGVSVGEKIVSFELGGATQLTVDDVVRKIYEPWRTAQRFADIDMVIGGVATTTIYLTHLYGYVLAVKIGDTYHDLGLYAKAEEYFLQASAYGFLNTEVEATALWMRMGFNVIDWGTSLYKNDNVENAKAQYSKIITETAGVPDSFFYTTASLVIPASAAKTFIQNILARPLPDINPDIARLILDTHGFLQQILVSCPRNYFA